jgi:hypothetical protein
VIGKGGKRQVSTEKHPLTEQIKLRNSTSHPQLLSPLIPCSPNYCRKHVLLLLTLLLLPQRLQ